MAEEKASKMWPYVLGILGAMALIPILLYGLAFLVLTSKPSPRKLARMAESLIPYISEIRPFVEENWERMDEVRLIKEKHAESGEPLTEEEEAIISSLFTGECPFTDADGRCFFTNYKSDVGSARLYVMYLPDDEWDANPWIRSIYYMEELVPGWYACTEPEWYGNNSPISFDDLRAKREDGGRVFLPGHDPEEG